METTANFIRWAIVLLTNHVSVQERLHSEIDSVIDRQKLPTLDDRSRSIMDIVNFEDSLQTALIGTIQMFTYLLSYF